MRCLPFIGVALLLGACASKPPGNEYGGLVMQGQNHPDKAYKEAQEHCEQYGKQAKLMTHEVHQKSDDPVMFECLGPSRSSYADRYERADR
jgi:hypothetical protein